MKRNTLVLLGALCLGALLVSPAAAQPRGGGPRGRGGQRMSPEEWKKMMEQQMTQRLQKAGVDEKQMPVVKAALQAKIEARQAYREKLGKLAADLDAKTKDPFVSDKTLLAALEDCKKQADAAEAEYKKVVQEQDAKIIAVVNAMTQVKLFLAGVLDNHGVYPRRSGGFRGPRVGRG